MEMDYRERIRAGCVESAGTEERHTGKDGEGAGRARGGCAGEGLREWDEMGECRGTGWGNGGRWNRGTQEWDRMGKCGKMGWGNEGVGWGNAGRRDGGMREDGMGSGLQGWDEAAGMQGWDGMGWMQEEEGDAGRAGGSAERTGITVRAGITGLWDAEARTATSCFPRKSTAKLCLWKSSIEKLALPDSCRAQGDRILHIPENTGM